jgi:hypothetical protein
MSDVEIAGIGESCSSKRWVGRRGGLLGFRGGIFPTQWTGLGKKRRGNSSNPRKIPNGGCREYDDEGLLSWVASPRHGPAEGTVRSRGRSSGALYYPPLASHLLRLLRTTGASRGRHTQPFSDLRGPPIHPRKQRKAPANVLVELVAASQVEAVMMDRPVSPALTMKSFR